MINQREIDARLAEYGVVIPMRERPKATREWVEREQELLQRIADLEEVNIALAQGAAHHDTHGLKLDAEANTRVTELEGRLRNYQIAVIVMGAVGATVIAGFVL